MIIAVALIIIVGIIYYFQNIKEHEVEIPLSEVIVAKEYIPENTVITKDMIFKEARYTHDLLKQKGYLTSKEENILGKRTRVPLYKDEPVNMERLIENKPYMDESDDLKKTMFTISINNLDKALDIKRGSYIDLWVEPNENGIMEMKELQFPMLDMSNGLIGFLNGIDKIKPFSEDLMLYKTIEQKDGEEVPIHHISHPFFKKLKVYDTKTEIYTNPTGGSSETEQTTTTFLTLYLTYEQIAKYLDMKDWNVNKRITLYGENVEYAIISEKLEDKPEENKEKNSSEDMQEIMESPTSSSGDENNGEGE